MCFHVLRYAFVTESVKLVFLAKRVTSKKTMSKISVFFHPKRHKINIGNTDNNDNVNLSLDPPALKVITSLQNENPSSSVNVNQSESKVMLDE